MWECFGVVWRGDDMDAGVLRGYGGWCAYLVEEKLILWKMTYLWR